MATINARMRQRRTTAAQWAADNPVLSFAEWGWETDTNRIKLGDGVTAWNDLGYFDPKNDEISAYSTAIGAAFSAATTLPLTATRVAPSANYALATNEITITEAGTYMFIAEAALEVDAGGGTNGAEMWVEVNAVELPGTRSQYTLRLPTGATGAATGIVQVGASAVVRIRAIRTSGSGTVRSAANGVRLNILRRYP